MPKDTGSSRKSVSSQFDKASNLAKTENREYCNHCKDGGDLICCDHCPRSFHVHCIRAFCKKNKVPFHPPPTNDSEADWYCPRCRPIMLRRNKEKKDRTDRLEARKQSLDERKKVQGEKKDKAKAEVEARRAEKKSKKEAEEA